MHNSKYVSIDFILDKVFRDNNYDLELQYADAIEWIGEVHGMVGAPMSYKTKITNGVDGNQDPLQIVDYRAELPCDFHIGLQAIEDTKGLPMCYATDTYHIGYIDSGASDLTVSAGLSYGFDSNYIWTSFSTGAVRLAYLAFPTDNHGLPMIPDNQKYIEAASCYIRMKIDYILWRQGKLRSEVYILDQQEWMWYVGAAGTSMRMPNLDKMEGIKNQYLRLIPSVNEQHAQYRYMNNQEQRKNHSDYSNIRY
jgi:hypothetical protein